MKKDFAKVDFQNVQNPNSGFDIVNIQDILNRTYEDHSPLEMHQVRFFSIVMIHSGNGLHTIDFIDYECKQGSILIIRKDQLHKFHPSNLKGALLIFTMEFLGSFFAQTEAQKSLLLFNEFLGAPKLQLDKKQYTELADLVIRLQHEYLTQKDSFSAAILRSELQILISKIYRIKSNQSDNILEKKYLSDFINFHDLVEENFTKSLKVKDYAKWLGTSTKTLNNVTQNILHKNAKEFIDEICITHIKRSLINSDLSIKEISFEYGFLEPSNFYNFFKKRVGQTPEEYRKANK